MDAINAARRFLGICWFDEEKCGQGIERMEAYRKKWNENLGVYEDKPLHDINSNGADAFQTLATGHDFQVAPGGKVVVQSVGSWGWT